MRRFACLILLLPMGAAGAEEPVSLSRYAYLAPGSTHAQRHPLRVTLAEARFPQEIATVGDALEHLLQRSGYRLDRERSPWARSILLPQPLPEVHRELGPIHLSEALGVLAGEAWKLSVNPLYRTLTIRPADAWLARLRRERPGLEIEDARDRPPPPAPTLGRGDGPAAMAAAAAAPPMPGAPSGPAAAAAAELPLPGSLSDPAEIFVDEMALRDALDLLVPPGWKLRTELGAALLQTRISLISSSTWWDALTELARKLGARTRSELQLHVFEEQRTVVLEQL